MNKNKIRALIYGCGTFGKLVAEYLMKADDYEILAFVDKNKRGSWNNKDIVGIDGISNYEYDLILISQNDEGIVKEVYDELVLNGVNAGKIKSLVYSPDFIEVFRDERTAFIKNCASWMEENAMKGEVAECGVFRGDSAKFINKYYSNRKLYLFDTFNGFNEDDYNKELNFIGNKFNSDYFTKTLFDDTSIDVVMSKMAFPENVIIKKGYFPETAKDVDEEFCFVNLDMDLYQPMLEGLRFFCPRMIEEGIILCHDYFHSDLGGVKKAIADYEKEVGHKLSKMPIGDDCSMAILKVYSVKKFSV